MSLQVPVAHFGKYVPCSWRIYCANSCLSRSLRSICSAGGGESETISQKGALVGVDPLSQTSRRIERGYTWTVDVNCASPNRVTNPTHVIHQYFPFHLS